RSAAAACARSCARGSRACGPARRGSQRGSPALHLVEDRPRSILLEEVTGPFQQVGPIRAGEQMLPALELRLAEGAVLERPADQRRLLAQPRKVILDEGHRRVRLV